MESVAEYPVLEIVKKYVSMKRSGSGYVGLCPFHDERSPSFHVNPSRNRFKCFGCGEGGDAANFLMKMEGLTFPEAKKMLDVSSDWQPTRQIIRPPEPEPSEFPHHLAQNGLARFRENNLYRYALRLFGNDAALVDAAFEEYGVRSGLYGRTTFLYCDQAAKNRGVNVMIFKSDGHRDQAIIPTWGHKLMSLEGFHFSACLFGDHLLGMYPNAPIALVESEKTAVLMSIFQPKYLWLAVGGNGANPHKLRHLKGRKITLFPDNDTFEKWADLRAEMKDFGFDVTIDTCIKDRYTQNPKADILDFFEELETGELDFEAKPAPAPSASAAPHIAPTLAERPPQPSPREKMIDKNPLVGTLVERLALEQSGPPVTLKTCPF